ncbi:MAG: FtsK/SpoIIIE domain-containing protein [Acidimicrobiales bacterium]
MADSTTRGLDDDALTLAFMAIGVAAVGAALDAWWALRHPRLTLAAAAVALTWWQLGRVAVVVLVALVFIVGAAWRYWHRASFDWCFLGAWRRTVVYAIVWKRGLTMAGLGDIYRHPDSTADDLAGIDRRAVERYTPKLGRVRSDRWCDRVSVRLLAGQHPGLYADRTDHLAHTFRARWCRVESPRPGRIVLVFGRRDPLATVVPALPVPERPAFGQLEIGRREDGSPWTVQLAGSHLLVAGSTGAGKGSVIWSIIRALAVPVHEGRVQLWCVDPKGGMELSAGAAMFHRFAYDTPAEMADLLDAAVDELHARAQRMRAAGHRAHTPTAAEPLVVLVVDELAFLTAYQPDIALRKRTTAALSVLLSKGRAVGFSVVAALQDPRKEVAPIRDLFPVRIGLRLTEPEQSRLVLGTGAHDRGAECEAVPVALPGVGYVVLEGLPDPVRVRASWLTDDDIEVMAERYPARRGDVIDAAVIDSPTVSTPSTGTAVVSVVEVAPREPVG